METHSVPRILSYWSPKEFLARLPTWQARRSWSRVQDFGTAEMASTFSLTTPDRKSQRPANDCLTIRALFYFPGGEARLKATHSPTFDELDLEKMSIETKEHVKDEYQGFQTSGHDSYFPADLIAPAPSDAEPFCRLVIGFDPVWNSDDRPAGAQADQCGESVWARHRRRRPP
jgi:hypothetical protein